MKNVTYISASAGSGKTYELTERLKKAILAGDCKPEEVILTTFTKAAASEFKEKAKAKFYEIGKVKEANSLDQALMGTVDSVANVFVNRYWYLLGISPKLNVISDEDEKVFIAESVSSLPTKKQNEFFHKFAETFRIPENHEDGRKYGIDYNFWKEDLKVIFNASRSYGIKDFKDSIDSSKRLVESLTLKGSKLNFDREELLSKLETLDAISNADRPTAARDNRISETEKFRNAVNDFENTNLDLGFALFDMITKGKFTTRSYTECEDYISLENLSGKIWTCQEVKEMLFTYIEHLFDIAGRWQEEYIQYKKEHHIIDYTDMEEYFLKLITEEKYETVQEDISKTYRYLFVDEFQDCSPTQIKIFDRISELVKHTIWVGDYKQAIYGFRGSDTALVKAVSDRVEMLNGKPNETLGISHRSLPPLVDVTNKVFVPAFSDILREEEVALGYWDKLEEKYNASENKDLLRVWAITEKTKGGIAFQVATNIAKMISEENILPKDIAVLARANKELEYVSAALKEYNIPTLTGDAGFKDSNEITLLNSLLSLVVNPADTYARATVAFLTEKGFDAAQILDERFKGFSQEKKDWEYLEEIPLIRKLMTKRDEYKSQGIAGLVENLIIEMDLYNVVKSWPEYENCVNNLHTAIKIAKDYESHCFQMSMTCTIYGFIDYINNLNTQSAGSSDGVQLYTYHGAKGLEWKNVILLSLEDDILEENKMIKRNIYGIHAFHETAPDAKNPYPPMLISVLPWIFGARKNIPDTVKEMILKNPFYEKTVTNMVQEEKRLMYVAMTRASESLILPVIPKDGLLRMKQIGVKVCDSLPLINSFDVLGIGKEFVIEGITRMDDWKYASPDNLVVNLKGENHDYKNRDMMPSSYQTEKKVSVKLLMDSGKRISLKASEDEMDKAGTCLHDIFCVIEKNKDESFIESIVRNHGMEKEIPEVKEIISAWNNLENFLTEKFGKKTNTYHELPFKQEYEGQIFTGSMDLVWETKDGVVLVDYKSYPGEKKNVLDPENKNYAGIYAGQFECYERALKEEGKKILCKMIYYHVLGCGVEIK